MVDGEQTDYRIYDLDAYSHAKAFADEMTFNGEYYSVAGFVEVENEIHTQAEGNVLTVTRSDEEALVYLTFSEIKADSFTVDDGATMQTYAFDESSTRLITLHSDCTVTVNGGSANVDYREVVRDHKALTPKGNTGNLHFNLWMETSYTLGQ